LVDDDEAISFAMQRYFTARGFEVECACELEEAVALLANHTYAAMIADLRLTGVHGVEGLELVARARQSSTSTRTILLTAYGTAELEQEARRRGVDAVLKKPQPLPALAELLMHLLEGS
jgi:two-component system response regulator PilR (NtrC family)